MLQQKIIKAGNSLAVTIPAKLVRKLALKAKNPVKVMQNPLKNSITYIFTGVRQLTLSSQLIKNQK